MPLRKICRRPETDYRLQQLHAVVNEVAPVDQQKTGMDPSVPKQLIAASIHMETPVVQTNVPQTPQGMDMDVDQKKAETNIDVPSVNSTITPGNAPFTSVITTSTVPQVTTQTQDMLE